MTPGARSAGPEDSHDQADEVAVVDDGPRHRVHGVKVFDGEVEIPNISRYTVSVSMMSTLRSYSPAIEDRDVPDCSVAQVGGGINVMVSGHKGPPIGRHR